MFSLFLLSFVQSITEFLPISSSGHLFILNKFGITEQGLGFDVLLHLGTLLAVILYFGSDLWTIIKSLRCGQNKRQLYQLLLATMPICFVGFMGFSWLNHFARNLYFVAMNSIFWGIILWWVDLVKPTTRRIRNLSWGNVFLIGCAQVLSLIPGTSRSGITMTCGRFVGLNRTDAARFSMLLSIPTICAAVLYVLYLGTQSELHLPAFKIGILAIGMTAILGMLVITFLMNWIKKSNFGIFAIYRILLGIGILTYLYIVG